MNTVARMPASEKPSTTIFTLLDHAETKSKFDAVLQNTMSPDRMVRLAINACRKTPKLLQCEPYSVFGALMIAASLGLEPNTILGHAFLIPYKKSVPRKDANGRIMKDSNNKWLWDETFECQFQVGYKGYIDLMYRSGVVAEVQAEAIFEGDVFKHQFGTETVLRYEKKMVGDRGTMIGSFCYTKLRDGQSFTVLPLADIHKARAKSETYRSLNDAVTNADDDKKRATAQKKLNDTPWVASEDVMAAKTAIRRHSSKSKISPQFNAAALIDGTGDEGRLDLAAFGDVSVARQVADGEYDVPLIEHDDKEPIAVMQEPTREREPIIVAGEKEAAPGEKMREAQQTQQTVNPRRGAKKADAAKPAAQAEPQQPAHDPETGEVLEDGAHQTNGEAQPTKISAPSGFNFG